MVALLHLFRSACVLLLLLLPAFGARPLYQGSVDLVPGLESDIYVAVVYDSTLNRYHAAGQGTGSIMVADAATKLVTTQFATGSFRLQALAVEAAAHRLYAVGSSQDLPVVNTVSGAVSTAALPDSPGSTVLAVDPGLHRCYVA